MGQKVNFQVNDYHTCFELTIIKEALVHTYVDTIIPTNISAIKHKIFSETQQEKYITNSYATSSSQDIPSQN